MLPYRQRAAGAVIHTHSPNAVMATLLWSGKEFRCSYLEMIKVCKKSPKKLMNPRIFRASDNNPVSYHQNRQNIGMKFVNLQGIFDHELGRYLRYDEELVVPIIENTPFEKDLEERMNATMQEYPGSTAILVRRHGLYVWGDTWQQAKTQ